MKKNKMTRGASANGNANATLSENASHKNRDDQKAFLHINDTPVYFQEDWDIGIGGGLWSTGLAVARYLQHHPGHAIQSLNKLGNNNLSLLELGSGNGFLALCFLALRRWKELVITDIDTHLPLIQTTLDANAHLISSESNVQVTEHKWGELGDALEGKKFDVIVGSDVAYHEDLYDILISSLARFSHESTVALIGVTMNDTKPLFFRKLREAGFRYERLADWLMEPEFRGTTFGIFVIFYGTK
jgi:2-polyprenyl-3-methyl-5-hydroxy-6-metoxy-1,4-benzoquinol methylase